MSVLVWRGGDYYVCVVDEIGGTVTTAELNEIVRKLSEAKAVSEWHFRDAVQELIEEYEKMEYYE